MLTTLEVPYTDTRAADLVWTLTQPVIPALASLTIVDDETFSSLELRILGASHQVVLGLAGCQVVETVACLPGQQPHLPPMAGREVGGRDYRFRSHVASVPAGRIHAQAKSLRQLAAARPGRTAIGEFPSSPDAMTALAVATPGLRWQTWHLYPNSSQIVTTSTEVLE